MRELYKKVMFEQITKKAECLYNLIGKKPGFDIFKAVTNLGGCYVQDKNNQLPSGIDAKINVIDDNTFRIIYKSNTDKKYIRFCIAHELGHLFLHMTKKNNDGIPYISSEIYYKNNDFYNLQEWEAEEFAACFLMPEHDFKNYIREVHGDINQIAKKFDVPSQSVITRCLHLELF